MSHIHTEWMEAEVLPPRQTSANDENHNHIHIAAHTYTKATLLLVTRAVLATNERVLDNVSQEETISENS